MEHTSRKQAKARQKRDGSTFIALPHVVLDSEAYLTLSHPAVRLLNDIARQLNGGNNGKLLCSLRHMSRRGWTSPDTLGRAKKELIEHGLVAQTVQGRLPNKASWYGLTWLALDEIDGLEITAKEWPRGLYRHWTPEQKIKCTGDVLGDPPISTGDVL
jgi:hypothetical protein